MEKKNIFASDSRVVYYTMYNNNHLCIEVKCFQTETMYLKKKLFIIHLS